MTRTKQKKTRTYARNRAVSGFTRSGRERIFESDGVYFLKLVSVIVLGTIWLKFENPSMLAGVPLMGLPIGMFAGLILVSQFEKLQSNRKIWYAILLLVTITSYFLPAGIVI